MAETNTELQNEKNSYQDKLNEIAPSIQNVQLSLTTKEQILS